MLRGQTYDGASNMSGIYNGAQSLIRQTCPLATFVHCSSHCTNLVAQQACESSPVVRDALSLVNELGVLMHQSGKSKAVLQNIISSVNPGYVNRSHSSAVPHAVDYSGCRYDHCSWAIALCAGRTIGEISTGNGDTATCGRGLCDKFSSGVTILALQMALVQWRF